MGLIGGIFNFNNCSTIPISSLNKILVVQNHRDKGKPVIFTGEGYSLGMVNSQDNMGNENIPSQQSSAQSSENRDGVYAFVDGIVLDVPIHQQYFERKGHTITSPSGGSMVALAYKEWGMDFMGHLEGEFACAVWDGREKKLILARDPYGHKPLHYFRDENKVIFASEVKGILAGGVSAEIDLVSLSDFLSLNCIPYPATIFRNIKQVSPGGLVVISTDTIRSQEYWFHRFDIDDSLSLEEAIQDTTNCIKNAIKKRMVSGDTYCFLSGGIDSSALISFASELSTKPVHAVTVGFDEKEVNELEVAKLMAKHVGAVHHHVVAKPDTFLEILDKLVYHHDSPFTDTSAYPTYYAAKLARDLTNIILTGDGPDQTMGGSGHHVFAVRNNIFSPRSKIKQTISRLTSSVCLTFSRYPSPSVVSKISRKLYRDSLTPVHAAYDLRSYFPDIVKRFICAKELWQTHHGNNPYRHPESWFLEAGNVDDVNKYLFADIKFYVTDDLMIKVDRMCMAHGLETLSPFQDIQLAKVINRLPGAYKIHLTPDKKIVTKFILKKVCEKRFPPTILNKKKQGFGIPLAKWLRHNNGSYLKEILLDSRTLNRGYFRKRAVEQFVNDFIQNRGDYFYPSASGVVSLLTLELWHRKYLD